MATYDASSLWESVLAELQLTLSSANFQTWFKGKTAILSINDNLIEIACATPYNKVWIEERYLGKIKEIVDRLTGTANTLVFTVSSQGLPIQKPPRKITEGRTVPLFVEEAVPGIQADLEAANINQKYSFANFVVGQPNQLAFAAAKAVAEAPFDRYNPLLIYGGVGIGKTHLLNAVAAAAILRHTRTKVLYCSSETFTNEMVEAIQRRQTIDFRSKYRGVDFLLVDDVQFIAGRESTQEEFFHTFNHLYSRGKQLVFSCDRHPQELSNLQERLKSRFAGGLVVAIDPPDLELREAILLAKAKESNLELDSSVIHELAENLGPSIRDLEGGLTRVAAAARLTGQKIDSALIQTVIGLKPHSKKSPAQRVIESVGEFFSLTSAELKSQKRAQPLVFPRQIAMYLLRKNAHLSYKEIAQELGGRDHTTVIYSVNKVEEMVENGGEVANIVGRLRKNVFGC